MKVIENLEVTLLAVALSMDAFSVMMVEGSMIRRLRLLDLVKIGGLLGGFQTVVIVLSNWLTQAVIDTSVFAGTLFSSKNLLLISILIFVALAFYMLRKGYQSYPIIEKCQEKFSVRRLLYLATITSLDSLVAGISLGILNTSIINLLITFSIISILAVILGVVVGYWFGFEHYNKAYTFSGIVLLALSINLIDKL